MRLQIISVFALAFGYSAHLIAGGPVQVKGGAALLWDTNEPIAYRVDKGPLGSFPEPSIQQFVDDAFQKWADVATARLRFKSGSLGEDVKTATRFLSFLKDGTSGNVVILDNSGAIIEAVYGVENVDNVLGFASPRVRGDRISRFVALMNGALATDEATIRSTMVHEFGHAIGLDHTQINTSFAHNGQSSDDQFLPTMFPTATDDDTSLIELNPDDVAAVSRLYPGPDVQAHYGTIKGVLLRASRDPVLGGNIVAAMIKTGGAEDSLQQFSCVSDFLMAGSGAFELFVVPGNYRLRAEPVSTEFGGGSSVGPYAETASGLSFTNPIRTKRFAAVISVAAGQTVDVGALVVN